ncbi:MAG: tetratricopeptide repeat protein [Planctomycetia bacterium]|nr:tetratricopeptide repeat protein [Planctomycetia bacterium]
MPPARSSIALPTPTPDQRRIAIENFDRARQVMANGDFDYAIQLLLTCCKIDPGNFGFRQLLRRAQKEKYGNNLRGSRFAFLSTPRMKARVKAAKASGDYVKVLEYAEQVLGKNPWDTGTQMDMAEAFDALGLLDLAVFSLDQARQKDPRNATLNRALARLFEKRGDFQKAIVLWQLVKEVAPNDVEASHKAKDLAASETIARGKYQESVDGTKPSPILDKIEQQTTDKVDKLTRETEAIQKRIEADPTEPSLYLQLALAFRKAGQEERARATLQQGLGPTGNHFSLQLELMELDLIPLRKNLDITESKIKAKRERRDPDDVFDDGPTEEELVKLRAKQVKEINAREIGIFRTRADRTPADLSLRLELGTRLLKADLIDEAIAELQHARRDEKIKGMAALYLGLCFRRRANWRLAQRNFEEALQSLSSGDELARKEVLFQLATGSAEIGEVQRAIDLGHELANMDFSFRNIGKLLDEWQNRLQKA